MDQFIKYIKSLENRIIVLENKEPIIKVIESENIDKMSLSYNPDWRNDLDLSEFTHISHCFIHREDQWNKLKEIKGIINGVSIGGWNEREWLRNDLFNIIDYTIKEIEKRPWIKYLNIDLEYPKTNDDAIKMLKYTREKLPTNIKLCVACGLWKGHIKYQDCSKYLDWIELMSYDTGNTDISKYLEISLKHLEDIGFGKNKILIGYSNDNGSGSSGDTPKSIEYKKKFVDKYLGKMLWNNPTKEKILEKKEDKNDWKDSWNNPYREMVKARRQDIYDTLTTFRGNGKCMIENGIMKLSGSQPRLYVNIDIQNVEVSVDFKRIGNDGMNWSGGNIGVRSDVEGHSKNPEKAHTYYFRMKHENRVDFYREIKHGNGGGSGNRKIINIKKYKWNSNTWYNMKFRCFNLSNNKVKLEGYVNNELVLEYEDNNKIMFNASGIVFIRNTSIKEAQYKNFIIKKI